MKGKSIHYSAEGLKHWTEDDDRYTVDAVLEYCLDAGWLTEEGKKQAYEYWKKYISQSGQETKKNG